MDATLKPSTLKQIDATLKRAEKALATAEATIKKLDERLAVAVSLLTDAQLAEYRERTERVE